METNDEIKQAIADGIAEGVKAALVQQPAQNTPGTVVVTGSESDRPFRNIAEQARAIKAFEMSRGRNEHPRLAALKHIELEAIKASGASEGVPADFDGFQFDLQASRPSALTSCCTMRNRWKPRAGGRCR